MLSARDFPGGPVVKTLCFQCRGPGSSPLFWELGSYICLMVWPSEKKKKMDEVREEGTCGVGCSIK